MKPIFPEDNGLNMTAQYRAYGGFRNFMLQKDPELQTKYQACPWGLADKIGCQF